MTQLFAPPTDFDQTKRIQINHGVWMKQRQADWEWQRHRPWIVDAMTIVAWSWWKSCIISRFLTKNRPKSKIGDRQCTVHKETVSLCTDDRQFASWQIIITDILNGGIGGLAGQNQSLSKFAVFALDSSHFSPTLWGVFPLDSENPGRELWGTPPITYDIEC